MQSTIRVFVAVFFGFVFFGAIQHYFRLDTWVSVLLSVVGGIFSALTGTLDLLKKWYDLRKVMREDKMAERAEKNGIYLPTADEIRKHGQSAVERTLNEKFRNVGEDALKPRRFVVDSREEKVRPPQRL